MTQRQTLTQNQERALVALLTCQTQTEAAEVAGVSTRAIRRYLRDETFLRAYREARTAIVDDVSRRLVVEVKQAIQTLDAICRDEESPATARVQAARSLLDAALHYSEYTDLLKALRELESGLV